MIGRFLGGGSGLAHDLGGGSGSSGGSGGGAGGGSSWSPLTAAEANIARRGVWLPSAYPLHQWKLNATSINTAHPVADDLVGQIDEPLLGRHFSSLGDSFRPQLKSDSGRAAYHYFDGNSGSTARRLSLLGSTWLLSFVPWSGKFAIMFWVRADESGVTRILLDCLRQTGANQGFFLDITSLKLQFFIARGGSSQVNITTANACLTQGVWHRVKITGNGTGNPAFTITVDDTAQAITGGNDNNFTAGTVSAANRDDLCVGAISSGATSDSTAFKGGLSDLWIVPDYVPDNDPDWIAFKSFSPTLKSSAVTLARSSESPVLDLSNVSFLKSWWYFGADSGTDKLFVERDGTFASNPTAAAGQTVGAVIDYRDKAAPFSTSRPTLGNWLTASSDARRARLSTNIEGFLSVEFGHQLLTTVTRFDMGLPLLKRGAIYIVYVVRQTDPDVGSHILTTGDGGTLYLVITDGWPGNPNNVVFHDGDAGSFAMAAEGVGPIDGAALNIVEFWSDGSAAYLRVNRAAGVQNPFTSWGAVGQTAWDSIGPAGVKAVPGGEEIWAFQGYPIELGIFSAVPPSSVRDQIVAALATYYGVTLP